MCSVYLSRVCLMCVLTWLTLTEVYAQETVFPRPMAIEPAVAFWTRVYTEVGTTGGFIHDDTRMDVVYEVMAFPEGISSALRTKRIEEQKKFIATTLRKLSEGVVLLTEEEQRIRAAWPEDTVETEFREASERVRFQLGQADRFKEGLIRSGAWRDAIRDAFKNQGLPEGLAALPHVESSFNTHAYSKVGAAGMWQFMRTTGKRFLRIDNVVDERLDPYKATSAAANFMQQNFAVVQSWALAVTAYNHGAGGMLRAKEQLGTDDIGEIIQRYQSKTFGFASRNFYACFLAALEIDTHPEKYFPGIKLNPPDNSQVMPIKSYASLPALAKSLQVDTSALKQLNPSLLPPVWNGSKRIPSGFELRVPGSANALASLSALPSAAVAAAQISDESHRVRQGDTLSSIALKYGVSVQQLATMNGLRQPYRVTVGQVLKLPVVAETVVVTAVAAPASGVLSNSVTTEQALRHTVKAGDTLIKIAQRYSVILTELMTLNNLSHADQIRIGQVLLIRPAGLPPANAGEVEEQLPTLSNQARAEKAEPKTEHEAEEMGPTLLPGVQAAASADPADYAVQDEAYIVVEAGESLSHYAEWLNSSPAILRSLNHMTASSPVQLGAKLKLDFAHASVKSFEERRTAFHLQMQSSFFAQYRIVDSYIYVMKKGDSIWSLLQKSNHVPLWLLRQYNPDVALDEVKPGTKLIIPNVKPIEG